MPTWLIFILVLSILVLVHELGHFFAAKLLGIKVEEFAFGLPFTKPIFKVRFGETQYAIYPLLFGGFVRMLGEESEVKNKKNSSDFGRDFWSRAKGQRLLVIVAGVVMNVVLALVGFGILYSIVGVPIETRDKVTVVEIVENSPADEAGINVADRILAVEGREIKSTEEFGNLIKSWSGLKVNLTIERGSTTQLFEGVTEGPSEKLNVTVTPRVNPPEGQGAVGVVIVQYPYIKTILCQMTSLDCLGGTVKQGIKSTGIWMSRVLDGLRSIGKSLSAGKSPEGVAGPVGIYQLTGLVAAAGWLPLVELVAILSVNLAVFNILPIPALDGGRAFFIMLEVLMKKRIPAELEQKVNSWGMIFLLTLMALISLQDVWRLGIFSKFLGQ